MSNRKTKKAAPKIAASREPESSSGVGAVGAVGGGGDVTFTIAIGTYEHALMGVSVTRSTLRHVSGGVVELDANADASEQMPTVFARTCHTGSIRAVAMSSTCLVTGSADETMRLFSLRRGSRRELGVLTHHSGAVNALALFGRHALSAADDGTVAVWRVGRREWKLHAILGNKKKAPVLDLAVHPTGRVLLTVAKDRRLYMWNLVNAQLIYKQQHPAESQRVAWSPTGAHYALVQDKRVLVFSDQNELVKSFDSDLAVHSAVFSPDGSKIACAGEDKIVYVYALPSGKGLWAGTAHQRRVKDLRFLDDDYLVSACSLGDVCVWEVRTGKRLLTRKLDCRINTIAVAADGDDNDESDDDSVEFDGQDDDDDDDDDDDGDDEGGYVIDHDAERRKRGIVDDNDDDDDVGEESDVIVGNAGDDDDDDDNKNEADAGDDEDDDAEFQKAVANNFRDYEQLAVETVDSGVSAQVESEETAVLEKKRAAKRVIANTAKKAKRRNDKAGDE